MQNRRIETGALVVLKSGGPVMTVRAVSQHQAYCDWFDHRGHRQGTFDMASLELAPEPSDAGQGCDASK